MKKLIQLIKKTPVAKLKSNGLWGLLMEPNSKTEQLCDAILDGKVKSDEDAIKLLYPGEKSPTKYYNLKERLKEKLLNAVLWIDVKDGNTSDRQAAFFECNKRWAIAMTLMSRNAKSNAIDILEDTLKDAIRFEFTELTVHVLSSLRLYYSTVMNDSSKYNHYRDLLKEYQEIWDAENEVEGLYLALINQFIYNKTSKESLSTRAAQYHEQIAALMSRYDSFRLQLCGRLIELSIYSGTNNFEKIIALSQDAISFFNQKNYSSVLALQTFYYQQMLCYIHLKDYKRGKSFIEQHSNLFEPKSFNWFKLQELSYLLNMHTDQYEEALELTRKIQLYLSDANQPPQNVELWKLYEAYAMLMTYFQCQQEHKKEQILGAFKVAKILNEVPNFHKDKRGMNIPIIVLQLLYNLIQKNYSQVADRIDAVEKYCNRYLNNNETFRSNCFIRLLLNIPAVSFKKNQVELRAAKMLEQLKSKPLNMTSQSYEVEIIPYEHLWEIVSGQLPEQVAKFRPRKRSPKAA